MEDLTASRSGSNGDQLRSALSSFYDAEMTKGRRFAKKEDSYSGVEDPTLHIWLDTQEASYRRYLGSKNVVSNGFVARFIYVKVEGKPISTPRSAKAASAAVPEKIITDLVSLYSSVISKIEPQEVDITPDADAAFMAVQEGCAREIKEGGDNYEILNRAHINAGRLAAVVAVACSPHAPCITKEQYDWAYRFVRKGYDDTLACYKTGLVGAGESVRMGLLRKALVDYVRKTPEQRVNAKAPRSTSTLDGVVGDAYLITALKGRADFKGSDTGFTSEDLVRRTIDEAIRQDVLVEVMPSEIADKFGVVVAKQTRMKFYLIAADS